MQNADGIAYQIDKNGERIEGVPNFYVEFANNLDEDIWIYIRDENEKDVSLDIGTRICFNHHDLDQSYNYMITERNMGCYKVSVVKRNT